MHDLGRSWNDLLQQMRAAIDLEKDVDARRETLSFADMMPVVLVADPDRVDQHLLALPPFLRQRLLDRPFRLFQFTRPEKATMPACLDDWQKKQLQKLGYATTVINVIDLHSLPRGRRQLDEAEVRLRQALELWCFALIPQIKFVFSRSEALSNHYNSVLACIGRNAPNLLALAKASKAAPKSADMMIPKGNSEDYLSLRLYLGALEKEGRKRRIAFAGQGEFFGECLRVKFEHRGMMQAPSRFDRPEKFAEYVLRRIEVLEVIAKGIRIADTVFSQRTDHQRYHDRGVDRLADQGAHAMMFRKGEHGKRRLSVAAAVVKAQRPDEYVQPLIVNPENRLTAPELAALAYLCDIDPFVLCAQHQLLCPEVWAARAVGAAAFSRYNISPEDAAPLVPLLTSSDGVYGDQDVLFSEARNIAHAVHVLNEMLVL